MTMEQFTITGDVVTVRPPRPTGRNPGPPRPVQLELRAAGSLSDDDDPILPTGTPSLWSGG